MLPDELPAKPTGWTREMSCHLNLGGGKGAASYKVFTDAGEETPIGFSYNTSEGTRGFTLPDVDGVMTWDELRALWPSYRRGELIKFPVTRVVLLQAHWTLVESRPCKACAAPLEFWRSKPKSDADAGAIHPLEVRPELNWQLDTHWRHCPRAGEFRKKKPPPPDDGQKELFK